MYVNIKSIAIILITSSLLASCGGSAISSANNKAVANAGADQFVSIGALVSLSGSASTDADGDAMTYKWTLTRPADSSAVLSDAKTVSPSFTADVDGTYFVSLVVHDGFSSSVADEVVISTVWMLNPTGTTAAIITNPDSSAVEVNVQSVTISNVSGTDYYLVGATGIPSYQHTMTTAEVNTMNARPKAASDFRSGSATTATNGGVYNFGADLNYASGPGAGGCYSNYPGSGLGWWPPGPSCPTDQNFQVYLPVTPEPATSTCYTQTNAIGLYKNGTAIFNWSDGVSYNNAGVWHQLAAKFEAYDLDVCFGHATQAGTYHQHMEANCLTEEMGDNGTAHSAIYGYAADGYPIHGPWHASAVKAESCWKARDYNARFGNTTGCVGGGAGQRTCVLNNPYDYTAGTTAASGPLTSATVTSSSGNNFVVASGYYFEDYYYDSSCTATGGKFLDQHNGHDHDSYGYHYHVTDTFPYNVGPTYYGKLHSNALGQCGATASGP